VSDHGGDNSSATTNSHNQNIDSLTLSGEGEALMDAEPVLLINHHKREFVENYVILKKGMGTNDDGGCSCFNMR